MRRKGSYQAGCTRLVSLLALSESFYVLQLMASHYTKTVKVRKSYKFLVVHGQSFKCWLWWYADGNLKRSACSLQTFVYSKHCLTGFMWLTAFQAFFRTIITMVAFRHNNILHLKQWVKFATCLCDPSYKAARPSPKEQSWSLGLFQFMVLCICHFIASTSVI